MFIFVCFFFQAEDGIRDYKVTGVQTCALPIYQRRSEAGLGGWDASYIGGHQEEGTAWKLCKCWPTVASRKEAAQSKRARLSFSRYSPRLSVWRLRHGAQHGVRERGDGP